jgi:hypothetical protein
MGRRIYETDADRSREASFINDIENSFQLKCVKLPYHWQFDMFMTRKGWAIGIGEVKHAFYNHDKYPHALCSAHKITKGLGLTKYVGMPTPEGKCKKLPFILFVRYLDGDYYARLNHPHTYRQRRITAKNHADDPTDTEWCCQIPFDQFKAMPSL